MTNASSPKAKPVALAASCWVALVTFGVFAVVAAGKGIACDALCASRRPLIAAILLIAALNHGCGRSNSGVNEFVADVASPTSFFVELPPVISDDTKQIAARLRIRNPTPHLLRLTDISSSCGCLSAELGSSDLAPFEETHLDLVIGLGGQRGRRIVHCRLKTDRDIEFEYRIAVTAVERIQVNPHEWSLGLVDTSEKMVRHVTLSAHAPGGEQPPRVMEVTSDYEGLECAVTSQSLVESPWGTLAREVSLRLALSPRTVVGPGATHVRVRYQQGDEQCERAFPVFWRVDSLYVVRPARLVCTSTDGKYFFEREIVLERRDSIPFEIRSAESCSEWIAVSVRPSSAPSRWMLNVRIDGTSLGGRVSFGQLTVTTDVDEAPDIMVPIVFTRVSGSRSETATMGGTSRD